MHTTPGIAGVVATRGRWWRINLRPIQCRPLQLLVWEAALDEVPGTASRP